MAKKFVRNITGTKIKGEHQEPLWTNMQNDLLSDDEDVAVRNNKEYHLLTDNLKTHLVTTNAFMSISEKEKNGLKLNVRQASGNEVKNAVDTPRVINPKQAKDMIEQRTPKIVRDIIETDVPQSDWNETDPNSKAFIRNKPDIENGGGGGVTVPDFSSQAQAETGTNNNTIMTPKSTKQAIDKQVPLIVAEQATTIIEQNFEALPQPDWDETNEESHGFIKNKPNIPDITVISNKLNFTMAVDQVFVHIDNTDDYYFFRVEILPNFNIEKFSNYFSKIEVTGYYSGKASIGMGYVQHSVDISKNLLSEEISSMHSLDLIGDSQLSLHIKKSQSVIDDKIEKMNFRFVYHDFKNNILTKTYTPTQFDKK